MQNKIETEKYRGKNQRRISVENLNEIESKLFVSHTFMKVDNALLWGIPLKQYMYVHMDTICS